MNSEEQRQEKQQAQPGTSLPGKAGAQQAAQDWQQEENASGSTADTADPALSEKGYDIYWGTDQRTTNLHGAQLMLLWDGSVEYDNRLLASGILIHRWTSRISFQARASATLPLLEEGAAYEVQLHLRSWPERTVFLEFDFYDRQDNRIKTIILTDNGQLTCPEGTYYYEMKLVQGGAARLRFDHISITKLYGVT